MKEIDFQRQVQLQATRDGHRLFRNNCGNGWMGTPCFTCQQKMRRVKFGVCNPGGSDLIGWTRIEINAPMVGRTVAIFTAREIKIGNYPATPEQERFLEAVTRAGGDAAIIRG